MLAEGHETSDRSRRLTHNDYASCVFDRSEEFETSLCCYFLPSHDPPLAYTLIMMPAQANESGRLGNCMTDEGNPPLASFGMSAYGSVLKRESIDDN